MTVYKVSATIRGKKQKINIRFQTKAAAQKYAEITNKNYPRARARVVKG